MPISGSGSGKSFFGAVKAAAQAAAQLPKKPPTGEVKDILGAFKNPKRSLEQELGRHLEKMEAAEVTDAGDVFLKKGLFSGGGGFSGVSSYDFLPSHEYTVTLQDLFIKKIGNRSIPEEKVRALARLIIKIVNNAPKGEPKDKQAIEQQTEDLVNYVVNNRYEEGKLSLIFPEDRGEYVIRSLINDTHQKMKQAESSTVGTSGGAEDRSSAQRGGPLPVGVVPAVGMSFLNQGAAEAKPQEASVTTPSAPPSEEVREDLGAEVAAPKKQGEVPAVFPSGSAEDPLQADNVEVVEISLHQRLNATIVPPIKNTSPSAPAAVGGGGDQDLARARAASLEPGNKGRPEGAAEEAQNLAKALAASLEPGNEGRPEGAAEHDPDLAAGIAASMKAGHEGRPEGAAEDDRALAAGIAASNEPGNEGRQLTPLEQALLEARPLKPPKS